MCQIDRHIHRIAVGFDRHTIRRNRQIAIGDHEHAVGDIRLQQTVDLKAALTVGDRDRINLILTPLVGELGNREIAR